MMISMLSGLWILWILFVLVSIVTSFLLVPGFLGAPWVPTQMGNVRKMLSIAEVKPGDIVYDLGSGDGRIIITAAKEFHARSVGVEVNPLWVLWTRWRIRKLKLNERVGVVWGYFFSKDLSKVDVVTLYLLQKTNDKLKQKLEKELKPGSRIVSHIFTFKDWKPVNTDSKAQIYLYKIGNLKVI